MAESATPPLAKSIVKISFILYANDSDLSTCYLGEESYVRKSFDWVFLSFQLPKNKNVLYLFRLPRSGPPSAIYFGATDVTWETIIFGH